MDNKQIIEEIDIIVRARVEEAREDIKNVAKETTKMVNVVSKEFQKMNKENNFDEMSSDIGSYRKQIQQLGEEARKVKVSMDGVSFDFTLNQDDINKKYQEAIDNLEANKDVNLNINALGDPADTKYAISQPSAPLKPSAPKQEEYALGDRLGDFDALTIKEQLVTVGMQIEQLVPQIKSIRTSFQETINDSDSLLGMLKIKVQEFAAGLGGIKNSATSAFDGLKSKVSSAIDAVKGKVQPVTSIFGNIGKIAQNAFTQASANIKEFAGKFSAPINKVKDFINKIKGVGNETDKVKKKGKGFGSDFGKSLSSGIKSIKKFALSLLSIRTAFSAVSKAAQAYLSFDTQLSDSIQNSWNVLGSLLAPMLEFVAGLFSKLVSVVAAFVQALTGIDLVARANAKGLDKQAKSTKGAASASKQLGSIDDISTLSSNSSSGGGDEFKPITTEAVDMSSIESAIARIKELMSQIFEPFKQAWEISGKGVIQSLMDMFTSLGELSSSVGGSFFEVWTNGTGTELINNVLLGWQLVFDVIGQVAGAITNAWNNANNGTKIIQSIADIFKSIQEFALSIGDSISKWVVSDGFQKALDLVFQILADIGGWLSDIADWILKMYDTYFKPVIDDKLIPALESIADMFTAIWNVAKPIIDKIIENIKKFLEPIIKNLSQTIGGIIDIVKGIADFITGVFTGNWKKAWNGIKTIFSGVWDSFVGIVKAILNAIIFGFESMINFVINGINKLLSPLRKLGNGLFDLVGANITIPKFSTISIPRLATGHVADSPLVAQVGEYANAKTNPEIISPVSMMKDAFRSVLSEYDFGGTRVDKLVVDVAGENFFDRVIDYINDTNARKGVSVIKEV